MLNNKLEEKGIKKFKDNRHRKKLGLIGLNKVNSNGNSKVINLNLCKNISVDIDINKIKNINNNNLIKSNDININTAQSDKKNKIQIFKIDKVQKSPTKQDKEENINMIRIYEHKEIVKEKDKEKPNDYLYLNFNFNNNQENIAFVGEYLEEIYMNLLLEEKQATDHRHSPQI